MAETGRKTVNLVIVGIGGVGSALVYKIARFCQFQDEFDTTISLIDGDAYENRNATRQIFSEIGNKAEVTAAQAALQFDRVSFLPFSEFLTPENIDFYIMDGSIVFVCVDNHKTRRLLDEHASALSDIILINGGNNLTDGNVQLYIRRSGKDVTASLSQTHPEIEQPTDKSPHEMSCEERAAESAPQLFVANDMIAVIMFQMLWNILTDEAFVLCPPYGEIYFDIVSGRTNPFPRHPTP